MIRWAGLLRSRKTAAATERPPVVGAAVCGCQSLREPGKPSCGDEDKWHAGYHLLSTLGHLVAEQDFVTSVSLHVSSFAEVNNQWEKSVSLTTKVQVAPKNADGVGHLRHFQRFDLGLVFPGFEAWVIKSGDGVLKMSDCGDSIRWMVWKQQISCTNFHWRCLIRAISNTMKELGIWCQMISKFKDISGY